MSCPSRVEYTVDCSAQKDYMKKQQCGCLEAKDSLLYGTSENAFYSKWSSNFFTPVCRSGLSALEPRFGWTHVHIPGM